MKFAVVQFPGSNCDQDCTAAINGLPGAQAEFVWHKETSLAGYDAIVLPGGFSYGDYLRCGAIAQFSPIMQAVVKDAAAGKLVIGICNGFQILCEAGLLPGALVRNRSGQLASAGTFRSDVNVDGAVNSGDAIIVRQRSGTGINP